MAQAFVPVSSLGLFPCRFNSRHSLCCPPLHCLLPLLGCSPPPATQSSPLILWEGAQMSPPLRTNHHPWRELGTFCVHGFCWTSLLHCLLHGLAVLYVHLCPPSLGYQRDHVLLCLFPHVGSYHFAQCFSIADCTWSSLVKWGQTVQNQRVSWVHW